MKYHLPLLLLLLGASASAQEAPWSWGDLPAEGSPILDGSVPSIRVDDEDIVLPPGTICFDQYSVLVLYRESAGSRFLDVASGQTHTSQSVLENGVASGEMIQLLLPHPDGGYEQLLNQRSSSFTREPDHEQGEALRELFHSQVRFQLRRRARKKAFREFWKQVAEPGGLPKISRLKKEEVATHLTEIVKRVLEFDVGSGSLVETLEKT